MYGTPECPYRWVWSFFLTARSWLIASIRDQSLLCWLTEFAQLTGTSKEIRASIPTLGHSPRDQPVTVLETTNRLSTVSSGPSLQQPKATSYHMPQDPHRPCPSLRQWQLHRRAPGIRKACSFSTLGLTELKTDRACPILAACTRCHIVKPNRGARGRRHGIAWGDDWPATVEPLDSASYPTLHMHATCHAQSICIGGWPFRRTWGSWASRVDFNKLRQ